MKLILLSCAWICGVYLGSRITLSPYVIAPLLIVPLLLLLVSWRRQALLWGLVCLAAVIGGILLFQWSVNGPTLHLYNDQGSVQIRGSVDGDPKYDEGVTAIALSARQICLDDEWSDVSGVVMIYCRGFAAYSAGDEILVTGELQTPISATDDLSGNSSGSGLQSVMFSPSIELTGRGWLSGFRGRLSQSLGSALPEPQGSVAQALVLGIRTRVPESLSQNFRTTGTAHIMAISGLHVAILGGIVLSSAAWAFGRQRRTYILVCFGAVWLYALLTGMHCPAYRAAIMFSLFLVALWIGRPHSALPSIALAAAVIVGTNPEALWEVSFQLSFAAVIGIVLLVPPLHRLGRSATKMVAGEEGALAAITNPIVIGAAVCLAATIATFPLIAYYFGNVSFVGLPATLVALPALPGAIIASALAAVVGLFIPLLAQVIGWVSWLFLTYIIEVVEAFASLPFASSEVSDINSAWVWSYYGIFLGMLWVIPSRKRFGKAVSRGVNEMRDALNTFGRSLDRFPKKRLALFLGLVAALIWAAVATAPDERLQVSVLDIGQGDSILIVTPAGQQILVDGGPDPEKVCLELGEKLPFWDKSLDMVVLTHPDDDHIAGLVEVLRRYQVGQVLEPGLEIDSPSYDEWLALIEEKDIERTIAVAGQKIDLGSGITMDVLHPQANWLDSHSSDINSSSVVLRLSWGDISFLLTGDIEDGAEHELLHRGCALRSIILKVGHHGSNSSSTPQFLAAVTPQVAVISAGEDNPFGHPHEDVMDRLEGIMAPNNIYVTSENGTVTFTTDGERLWVGTEAL